MEPKLFGDMVPELPGSGSKLGHNPGSKFNVFGSTILVPVVKTKLEGQKKGCKNIFFK